MSIHTPSHLYTRPDLLLQNQYVYIRMQLDGRHAPASTVVRRVSLIAHHCTPICSFHRCRSCQRKWRARSDSGLRAKRGVKGSDPLLARKNTPTKGAILSRWSFISSSGSQNCATRRVHASKVERRSSRNPALCSTVLSGNYRWYDRSAPSTSPVFDSARSNPIFNERSLARRARMFRDVRENRR